MRVMPTHQCPTWPVQAQLIVKFLTSNPTMLAALDGATPEDVNRRRTVSLELESYVASISILQPFLRR